MSIVPLWQKYYYSFLDNYVHSYRVGSLKLAFMGIFTQ